MAFRHYVETLEFWDHPDSATDNQWIEYDLSQHGIPPSAVVEVVIGNIRFNSPYYGGVRATSGTLDRRIQLMKSEDNPGESLVTMHVQADADGKIDYFSENPVISFNIVGYWVGCEYVEKFELFDPSVSSSWEGYALDQHGVGEGQVAEIIVANQLETAARFVSIRTSGSTRTFFPDIAEAEGGGNNCLSTLVKTSGNNAAIELWSEDRLNTQFWLLGYFDVPPGIFTELDILYARPTVQGVWEELDISAGLPSDCVAHIILSQDVSDSIVIGVRNTSSVTDRFLNLKWSETTVGRSFTSMSVNVDNSGYIQYYASDVSPDKPTYTVLGYWTDFTNSATPFQKTNSFNLFVKGRNPVIHYVESHTDDLSSAVIDSWQVVDMSTPLRDYAANSVAEIVTTQQEIAKAGHLGIRAIDSNLQRDVQLRDSYDNASERDLLTWHVQLDDNSHFEFFSSGMDSTRDDTRGLGYWVGAKYVELFDTFQASAQSGWVNHDLSSYGVPAGKIAEVVITSADEDAPQSGGIRQVGSSLDRLIEINGLASNLASPDGVDAVPMFVNTSGSSSTIQIYAGNSGLMNFVVVGYWDYAPGDFTELITDITPVTNTSVWSRLDLYTDYSIPSGAVVHICLGNYRYNISNLLGARQIDVKLSQTDSESRSTPSRRFQVRETNDGETGGWGVDVWTTHVNATSGYVEFYHERTVSDTNIVAFGYWDNFAIIPLSIDRQKSLFIYGRDDNIASMDLFISAHHLVGTSGVASGNPDIDVEYGGPSLDFFIQGRNPVIHYIEAYTTDVSPSTTGSWQTVNMSSHGYVADSVAEIVSTQQDWDTSAHLGIRAINSSLQRDVYLRDSYDGFAEADLLTWHVQLDKDKLFEFFSSGVSNVYDNTFGLGYWVGAKYVELFDTFQASAQSGWVNHDLSSYGVPAGKIAEIVITSADENAPQSGGVRQVGSTLDRLIEINGLASNWSNPVGVDAVPMFVNVSGASSTIQVYAGNSGLMNFVVVGYWDTAPGDFTESITTIIPVADTNVWRRIDLHTDYGIPSGAVVHFYLANLANYLANTVGVREIDPGLSQTDSQARSDPSRKIQIRETHEPSDEWGVDVWTAHVNAISGYAEFYHNQNNTRTRIYTLGYWDNFATIPLSVDGQKSLFICGHDNSSASMDLFIIAPHLVGTSGVASGNPDVDTEYGGPSLDLFTLPPILYSVSGNLFIKGSSFHDILDENDYPSGLTMSIEGSDFITPYSELLRNSNVIYYHPLDSFTEYTQEVDWTFGNLVPSFIGPSGLGSESIANPKMRLDALGSEYNSIAGVDHFAVAFWTSGLFKSDERREVSAGFGWSSNQKYTSIEIKRLSAGGFQPRITLKVNNLDQSDTFIPLYPIDNGLHFVVIDVKYESASSGWQHNVSIDGSGWQDLGINGHDGIPALNSRFTIESIVVPISTMIVDEFVAWSGHEIFTNQELSNLYELWNTHGKTMNEYTITFPTPIDDNIDNFIHGNEQSSASISLYIPGQKETGRVDLFAQGLIKIVNNTDLSISGSPYSISSSNIDLYIKVATPVDDNINLCIFGPLSENGSVDNFLCGNQTLSDNTDHYIQGNEFLSDTIGLYVSGVLIKSSFANLYVAGPLPINSNHDTLTVGHLIASGGFSLFIRSGLDVDAFIAVEDNTPSSIIDLSIHGIPFGSTPSFYTNNTIALFVFNDGAGVERQSSWSAFVGVDDPVAIASSGIWASFLRGGNTKNTDIALYINSHASGEAQRGILIEDSFSTFIEGKSTQDGNEGLLSNGYFAQSLQTSSFAKVHLGVNHKFNLYIFGDIAIIPPSSILDLFVFGISGTISNSNTLYIPGKKLINDNHDLSIFGIQGIESGNISLFVKVTTLGLLNEEFNLYTHGF